MPDSLHVQDLQPGKQQNNFVPASNPWAWRQRKMATVVYDRQKPDIDILKTKTICKHELIGWTDPVKNYSIHEEDCKKWLKAPWKDNKWTLS